jgi:hypothetical protein
MVKRADPNERVKIRTRKSRAKGVYREWQRNNTDKIKEYNNNHRKHDISKKEWEYCKKYFEYECAYCGITEKQAKKLYKQGLHKEHVEHYGSNNLSNCVPSCKICNSSKRKAELNIWYNKQEFFKQDRLDKIIKWVTEDYKEYIERK